MEGAGAAVLRPLRGMVVAVALGVRRMALCRQVEHVLHHLAETRSQGEQQGEHEPTSQGRRSLHGPYSKPD